MHENVKLELKPYTLHMVSMKRQVGYVTENWIKNNVSFEFQRSGESASDYSSRKNEDPMINEPVENWHSTYERKAQVL